MRLIYDMKKGFIGKDILDDIHYKLSKLWNRVTWPFLWFFKWVIKSAQYSWFLRDDLDWDHYHILNLLQYKLKRSRECLATDPHSSDERIFRQSREIRTCELLLERLKGDDYYLEPYHKVNAKWGIDGSDIEHLNFGFSLPEHLQIKYDRDRKESFRVADMLRQQDLDLFLKIFGRKYRGWWS